MDISEFISNINSQGFARASNFKALVTKPNGNVSDESAMMFRCESFDLPGRDIKIHEYDPGTIPYKIASDVSHHEIVLTFILSEDLREKRYFESWQDDIIGNYKNGEVSGNMFNLSFYKDYVGTIVLYKYSDTEELVYQTKLLEAWPNTIGSLQTSWDGTTIALRLSVSFTYRYYIDEND